MSGKTIFRQNIGHTLTNASEQPQPLVGVDGWGGAQLEYNVSVN